MNLLVTLNSGYIYPLCVMLNSLKTSNPNTKFDIYVAHSSLTEEDFSKMSKNINSNMSIHSILIDEDVFNKAPVLSRISKETYYRLLVDSFLPEDVDRILYIDPDTVVINDLTTLYNMDLKGNVIAAAPHTYGAFEKWNLARLGMKWHSHYINAGIILMDVNAWRKAVTSSEMMAFVAKNLWKLRLSDQDAINIFFDGRILYIDERLYNLDEKTYSYFKLKKKINPEWVVDNTVIVHFNGRRKPWNDAKEYKGNLGGYFEKYKDVL